MTIPSNAGQQVTYRLPRSPGIETLDTEDALHPRELIHVQQSK
jgi:hypothetical protein